MKISPNVWIHPIYRGVKIWCSKVEWKIWAVLGVLSPHCLMPELFVKIKGANILKQVISRNCNLLYNVQNNQPLLFFVWIQRAQRVVSKCHRSCWKAAWSAGRWTVCAAVTQSHRRSSVWTGLLCFSPLNWHFSVMGMADGISNFSWWQPLSPEPLF